MRSDDTLSKTLSKLIFFFSKTYVYIYLGNTIHIGKETYKIPSIPDYKMNVCTLIMAENMAAMAENPRSQASKATGQCLQRYLAATMCNIGRNQRFHRLTKNGFTHHYQLDEPAFILGVLGALYNFYPVFR